MPAKTFPYKYLALFYALAIFAVSSIPQATPPFGFKLEDKLLHFIEYAIFSLFLFLAFYASGREFFRKHVFLLSSLIGMLYAVSDEIHQKFVPGRESEFLDFVADCLGIVVVQIVIWLYLRRKRKRLTAV